MTPREPPSAACVTALAISSWSGVDNTAATDGAVLPQPVRRRAVVGNIVTRVPCGSAGSVEAEDDYSLDDEIDQRCGALSDDERHRHSPGLALELHVEEVVDTDLH